MIPLYYIFEWLQQSYILSSVLLIMCTAYEKNQKLFKTFFYEIDLNKSHYNSH